MSERWEETPVHHTIRKALWEYATRTDYDPENVEKLELLKAAATTFHYDVLASGRKRGRRNFKGLNGSPYRENVLAKEAREKP